jgi:hypothetical protein
MRTQRVRYAGGDLVRSANGRVELGSSGEERRGGMPSPPLRPLAEDDVADQRQAGVLQRRRHTGGPLQRCVVAGGAGDVCDSGTTGGDEVINCRLGAAAFVRHERRVGGSVEPP